MAGERAICQRVKAANGRLAAMLRNREDDDAILKIGRVRIKKVAAEEVKSKTKGGRAVMPPPDFTIPLPRAGRPRAADGITTTFHLQISHVTKSDPTGSGATNSAVGHAIYIERSGAIESGRASDHAGYIERQDAVEVAERPLVFSNISPNDIVRREYWRAVERCERAPHPGLDINATDREDWWEDAVLDLPWRFITHCENEQRRRTAHQNAPEALALPFKPERFHADRDTCDHIIRALKRTPAWSDDEPPVALYPGLSGRTQYRFVAELPHELSQNDRIQIVADFCAYLGSFARDEEGEEVGMMYTAAIHAPGSDNHELNYHLHIIAHDRPATWLPVQQCWDFEYAEEFKHRGETRTRYPYRQDKIPEVTRRLAPKKRPPFYNKEIAGNAFFPHLREKFAGICNERLIRRGIGRRIDGRSHQTLGIDKTPAVHLGTRASALERLGIATSVGKFNQASSWRYQEELDNFAVRKEIEELRHSSASRERPRVENLESAALKREQAATLSDLEELIRLSQENARLTEQALSRAESVRNNCIEELKKKYSTKLRADFEARLEAANRHIQLVQEIIRQSALDIRSAETERSELVLRYVQIDLRLSELVKTQKRLAQVARLSFASSAGSADRDKPSRAIGGLAAMSGLRSIGGLHSIGSIDKSARGVRTLGQMRAEFGGSNKVYLSDVSIPAKDLDRHSPTSDGKRVDISLPILETGDIRAEGAVKLTNPTSQNAPPARISPAPGRTKAASETRPDPTAPPPEREPGVKSARKHTPVDRKAEIGLLLDRISRDRIPVRKRKGKLIVDGLSDRETALLADRVLSALIKSRLLRIAEFQQREVGRLIEAIEKLGPDLSKPQIPPAVKTLARNWGNHPGILEAVKRQSAPLAVPLTNKITRGSSSEVPSMTSKSNGAHSVDIAREYARRRNKDDSLVASKSRMDNAAQSDGSVGKTELTSDTGGPKPEAFVPPTKAASSEDQSSRPVMKGELTAGRDAVSPTQGRRDYIVSAPPSIRPQGPVDLNSLHAKLATRSLPLREETFIQNGREWTAIVLDVEKAVPEDVELVKLAANYQSTAKVQELFDHKFKQLLANARGIVMIEPNATADQVRKLLNPKSSDRVDATLAAAASSPSFVAIVERERGITGGDELSYINRVHDERKRRCSGR